jgi:hypothetical protein
MVPGRVVRLEDARRRFGDRVDRLIALLDQGDELADAAAEALTQLGSRREEVLSALLRGEPADAPEAVRALIADAARVPFWADFERMNRGGRALLRTGIFGGFTLAFRSLVLGYCSPAGNKPLVMSGRLTDQAPRRIAETGRFVQLVASPDGMRRHGPGFARAVRVRLMHAQVRRLSARSPRWNRAEWGLPINQMDMAGTVLLFSLVVGDGLRKLGVPFDARELGDLLHLWRYTGHVLGVRDDVLPATEDEARATWEMIESTQAPPDDDSRALAKALIESPLENAKGEAERQRAARSVPVTYAISRFLIGDAFADALGFPKTPWLLAAPAFRAVIAGAGTIARRLPGMDWLMLQGGLEYWRRAMALGLGELDADFALPERLRHGG